MPLVIRASTVLFFFGRGTLAEQDFHFVAGFVQSVFEGGFILNPARFVFGRQHNANRQFTFASGGAAAGWQAVRSIPAATNTAIKTYNVLFLNILDPPVFDITGLVFFDMQQKKNFPYPTYGPPLSIHIESSHDYQQASTPCLIYRMRNTR
jgi:hypothetical protein